MLYQNQEQLLRLQLLLEYLESLQRRNTEKRVQLREYIQPQTRRVVLLRLFLMKRAMSASSSLMM